MSTDQFISEMQLPSGDDRRMRDVAPGLKRSFFSAQDIADTISGAVSGKRFRGDALVEPLRSVLPDQLSRGLNVVNTGLSGTNAQTDEIITQLIYAKPYQRRWEQGFVESTALFANRSESMFGTPNVHTVADIPILNFLCELGDLAEKQRKYAPRGNIANELVEMKDVYHELVPTSPEDFWDKWNVLGPMTTFKDAGIHSSNANVRMAQGAERMLGWSVYNRCHTFNLFGDNLKKGEQLYFIVREQDLSDSQQFVDPLGVPIVMRTSYPATALQIHGWTARDSPFPLHNTSYAADSFANPRDGDIDYIRREHLVAQEYKEYAYDAETDEFRQKRVDEMETTQEQLNAIPQLVYDAYMIGSVRRLGLARHTEGRAPTPQQIRDGHRSQNAMKLLQKVEIYRGL